MSKDPLVKNYFIIFFIEVRKDLQELSFELF